MVRLPPFSPRSRRLLSPAIALFICVAGSVFAEPFPQPANSGDAPHLGAPAMKPEAATAALKLPPGFRASLFAGEPDVQNPIAMAWDGRGRLWVAENYTYAERNVRFDERLRDRVVVFEDAQGDGKFSSRTVFTDSVQRLTSVEVGYGGVWLMCSPRLLFVPDGNGDAVPDGPPEIMLDGFVVTDANHHGFANGLRFGPDGWLYGRSGASQPAEVGIPGTPQNERVPLRGTMWRYHPVRRVVEALGAGTTNPWGHDWDENGELFFINTVNGHLWHNVAGSHYQRAHTIDPNPHVYELIDQHADHWHFDTSRTWQDSRDGAANALGGGHAHVGMMIYQGENWPQEYRGGLFTLNFHGRRLNHERLERHGSGYIGRHGPDTFISNDPWFRGIELSYGPDGGVFVLDWSDTGECHNSTGVNRTSGRIYKVTHDTPKRAEPIDFAQTRGRELAKLQASSNEWISRQARLEVASRAKQGHPLTHAVEDLQAMFEGNSERRAKLRALWALNVIGAAKPEFLRKLLRHDDEHVRVWAIRLLSDAWPLDHVMGGRPARGEATKPEIVADFVGLAKNDASGLVRLALASSLQRMPPNQRLGLASALMARREDATDHNLPLLIWYGLMPTATVMPVELARIAEACELPATRRLISRRLTEDIERRPDAINTLLALAQLKPAAFQTDVLDGMVQALRGWRRAVKPASWDELSKRIEATADSALVARARELSVVFGDGRALADVKALALDPKADVAARKAALQSIIDAKTPELRDVCERLLRVRFVNPVAARGLAQFDDPAIGELIATAYSTFFHPSERHIAIDVLATRPSFARALLQYIAAGKIPRSAVSAFHVRQIRSFGDAALNRQLAEVWGELRDSSGDKQAAIARLKGGFTSDVLRAANKSAGRATFEQLCAACHKLHGEGNSLGPDLTGSGRDNLDYLLENILDPSAVVTSDYRITVVKLKDGRTLNGFIPASTSRTVTVRGMSDTQTVERSEILALEPLPQSMMPEGLLDALTAEQRRDLIAYLMHPGQVPRP